MKDIQDRPEYSIFHLLQLLWGCYDRARYYLLWGNLSFMFFCGLFPGKNIYGK